MRFLKEIFKQTVIAVTTAGVIVMAAMLIVVVHIIKVYIKLKAFNALRKARK